MAAEKTSPRDHLLWAVSLLVLAGGIYGFYYFSGEVMTLVRVIGLLAAVGIAAAVFGQSTRGRDFYSFCASRTWSGARSSGPRATKRCRPR